MYCLCGLLYKHLKQFFPRYHPERKHQITVFLSLLSPSEWKVTGSLLESLIAKRNEYSKNCNKTLVASALSITGKPSASLHICHFLLPLQNPQALFLLQETTAKERLTCLCVGPTLLLEMCPSPVRLSYRGSVTVMLFYPKQIT